MADFPELIIRDYDSLIDALAAVKNHLQISNECLEELAGLCKGYADKLLARSRIKRIGPTTLGLLLGGLGVRLRVEVDLEAAERMARRWEKKHVEQVREHTRLSKQILELARPIILSEQSKKGWQTRRRQAKRNGNGHANGHAAALNR